MQWEMKIPPYVMRYSVHKILKFHMQNWTCDADAVVAAPVFGAFAGDASVSLPPMICVETGSIMIYTRVNQTSVLRHVIKFSEFKNRTNRFLHSTLVHVRTSHEERIRKERGMNNWAIRGGETLEKGGIGEETGAERYIRVEIRDLRLTFEN
ncbi:hypothetical protein ACLOJK_033722 [Asimina triloba]